jgi:hypothetical protein
MQVNLQAKYCQLSESQVSIIYLVRGQSDIKPNRADSVDLPAIKKSTIAQSYRRIRETRHLSS